jgi:hypothetical protein
LLLLPQQHWLSLSLLLIDPLLADCQWLLNLSADNDNTDVVVES